MSTILVVVEKVTWFDLHGALVRSFDYGHPSDDETSLYSLSDD